MGMNYRLKKTTTWKRELDADSLGKKWKDPAKMSLSKHIGKKRNRGGSKNREHDIMAMFHQLLLQKWGLKFILWEGFQKVKVTSPGSCVVFYDPASETMQLGCFRDQHGRWQNGSCKKSKIYNQFSVPTPFLLPICSIPSALRPWLSNPCLFPDSLLDPWSQDPPEQSSAIPGGASGKEPTCQCRKGVKSLGQEDPLEEGVATHSSILAWKIPWTEEPGGFQSIGSKRVGHNWSNLAHVNLGGLPWWLSGKESACQAGDMGSIPGSRRSPGEGKWQHTPVFLPGESHDQWSLVCCSPCGHKESVMS